MRYVGKPHWRQEESRHKQNVSKSKQDFPSEVQHAGMEGSWYAGAGETLVTAIIRDHG